MAPIGMEGDCDPFSTYTILTADGGIDGTFGNVMELASPARAPGAGTLSWRHAFGDTVPLAKQAFAGGEVFTMAGAPIAEDAAVIEAGFDLAITESATLGIAYTGQIASDA